MGDPKGSGAGRLLLCSQVHLSVSVTRSFPLPPRCWVGLGSGQHWQDTGRHKGRSGPFPSSSSVSAVTSSRDKSPLGFQSPQESPSLRAAGTFIFICPQRLGLGLGSMPPVPPEVCTALMRQQLPAGRRLWVPHQRPWLFISPNA